MLPGIVLRVVHDELLGYIPGNPNEGHAYRALDVEEVVDTLPGEPRRAGRSHSRSSPLLHVPGRCLPSGQSATCGTFGPCHMSIHGTADRALKTAGPLLAPLAGSLNCVRRVGIGERSLITGM